MAVIRSTVRLAHVNGDPLDDSINVWHFEVPNDIADPDRSLSCAKIASGLSTYYNGLAAYIGESISRTANTFVIQFTELTFGGPGPDDDNVSELIYESFHTLPTATTTDSIALPSEVAVCLSYSGQALSVPEVSGITRPRSRRRGRTFIGPLMSHIITESLGTAEVSDAFRTMAVGNYSTMVNSTLSRGTAPFVNHIIYSPTSGSFHAVDTVWMDNAFDTIRSRGTKASTRTTNSFTQGDVAVV